MSDHPILIADIGGTNARFAIASDQAPFFSMAQSLSCIDYPTIEDAIDTYLSSHNIKKIRALSFAVAGPIDNETVKFTNNHWSISCANLRQRYATDQAFLLNDFESIAYSLSQLNSDDIINIGGDWLKPSSENFTVAVIGPGSGLGVAGLCQREQTLFPIVCEAGHVGFSPENELQSQILNYLHKKVCWPCVTRTCDIRTRLN